MVIKLTDNILCRKYVELMGEIYTVYLKEVPVRIDNEGLADVTVIRAFVKKKERGAIRSEINGQTNHHLEKQDPD